MDMYDHQDHEGALVEHMRKLVVEAKMEGIKVGMLLNQADHVPRDQQTCETCQHWQDNRRERGIPRGYCRRYPPTPCPEDTECYGTFPVTISDECCGEWQAR